MGCGSSHSSVVKNEEEVLSGKDAVYLIRDANVKNSKGLCFEVKAPSDADILLCDFSEKETIRISIGSDKNRSITISSLTDPSLMAEVSRSNLLDPESYRCFWLQWHDAAVTVGSGPNAGCQSLLSLPLQQPHDKFQPFCIKVCSSSAAWVRWRCSRLLYGNNG